MGKRKWAMIIFVLLLFMGTYTGTDARQRTMPLYDIIHVMQHRNISVTHWGLYTKKVGGFIESRKGYVRWIGRLQSELPAFQWTNIMKDYEGNLKITGIHTDKNTNIHERITVLAYPEGNKWGTYFIYEVDSDHWDSRNWQQFSSVFQNRVHRFFDENPTIYTCVSGRPNVKMNFVLLQRAHKLLQAFSAVPVEGLREKTFVSLSAYTDQWKQSIQTKNHRMNLQVALRTGGNGATTVTIGTPIITTEY